MPNYFKFKMKEICNKYYTYILKFERPVKESSKYIYGKEVHIPTPTLNHSNPFDVDTYELETWMVKVPYIEDTFEFIPACRHRLESFMQEKMYEKEPNTKKWNKYTCHQLCDWQFLEDEKGVILDSNGYLTLVKYAIIIRDELWN